MAHGIKVEQIIEIKPNCKYVLVPKEHLTMTEVEQLQAALLKWQQSDEQFLILGNSLMMQRIDE